MISEKKLLFRAAFFTALLVLGGTLVLVLNSDGLTTAPFDQRFSVKTVPDSLPAAGQPLEVFAPEAPDHAEHAFILEVVPVVSSWNFDSLRPYLVEETIAASDGGEDIRLMLDTLGQRLGELEQFGSPRRVYEGREFDTGNEVDVEEYTVVAFYTGGRAELNLALASDNGEPSLYAFHVEVN